MVDEHNFDAAGRLVLSTQTLRHDDLDQAYVLVGLCHDTVTMEHWRRLVSAEGQAGPLVWQTIRDPRGYIHGLFAHRIEHDLVNGATLVVTDIVTAGPAWRSATQTIAHAMHALAREAGCPSLRVLIHPDRQSPAPEQLRAVFLAGGYSDRGPYLTRSLPQPVAVPED